MTSEELFKQCRKIGPAAWLLLLYWATRDPAPASAPDEMPWFVVMDGDPVSDQDVAAVFRISVYTAIRWRKKLHRNGFTKVESGAGGFCIHVARPRFAMAAIRALEEHGQCEWPKMPTGLVQ